MEERATSPLQQLSDWLTNHFTLFLIVGTTLSLMAGMIISAQMDTSNQRSKDTTVIKVKGDGVKVPPAQSAPKARPMVQPQKDIVLEGHYLPGDIEEMGEPKLAPEHQAPGMQSRPGSAKIQIPAKVAKAEPAQQSLEEYRVQPGDTLYRIAKKFYGDSRAWTRIAKENDDRLGNYKHLKVGQVLRIPIEIKSGRDEERRPVAGVIRSAEAPKVHKSSRSKKTYVVQKNDSLWKLSGKLLGDSKRWKELQKMNTKVLKGRNDLRAGMVLSYY